MDGVGAKKGQEDGGATDGAWRWGESVSVLDSVGLRDPVTRLQLLPPRVLNRYNETQWDGALSLLLGNVSLGSQRASCEALPAEGEGRGCVVPAVPFIAEVSLPEDFLYSLDRRGEVGVGEGGKLRGSTRRRGRYLLVVSLCFLYICAGDSSDVVYFTLIQNIINIIICTSNREDQVLLKTRGLYSGEGGSGEYFIQGSYHGDCVFSLKEKGETDFFVHVLKEIVSVPHQYLNFFGSDNGETARQGGRGGEGVDTASAWFVNTGGPTPPSRAPHNWIEYWPNTTVKQLPTRLQPFYAASHQTVSGSYFPPLTGLLYNDCVETKVFFKSDSAPSRRVGVDLCYLESVFHLQPFEFNCACEVESREDGDNDTDSSDSPESLGRRVFNGVLTEEVEQVLALLERGVPNTADYEEKKEPVLHGDGGMSNGDDYAETTSGVDGLKAREGWGVTTGGSDPRKDRSCTNRRESERNVNVCFVRKSPSETTKREKSVLLNLQTGLPVESIKKDTVVPPTIALKEIDVRDKCDGSSGENSLSVQVAKGEIDDSEDVTFHRCYPADSFVRQLVQENQQCEERRKDQKRFQRGRRKRMEKAQWELESYKKMLELKMDYNSSVHAAH